MWAPSERTLVSDNFMDKAKSAFETAKEKAGDVFDAAKEKVDGVLHSDGFENASDKVFDGAENITNKVTGDKYADKVGGFFDDADRRIGRDDSAAPIDAPVVDETPVVDENPPA